MVELSLSGGAGLSHNSARAGYLPVALRCVRSQSLRDIAVYLRAGPGTPEDSGEGGFALYRSASVEFTEADRERLLDAGRKFVYIRISDQTRFREQTERCITTAVIDPVEAVSERSEIIYETSVELVNELLAEPDLHRHASRLQDMSRAIATLVLSDSRAFSHLFAAAHHDFYTATHMVNVATWMVPLAYALGCHDPTELGRICQAGLLHDLGKVFVTEQVLNKQGRLDNEDWAQIRKHPFLGGAHLGSFESADDLVVGVAREHHERLDGSGYPRGLRGEEIGWVSRICAVVDSFDAMTALRPFKTCTMSVSEAILALKAETPAKYDPKVMGAWLILLNQVNDRELTPAVKLGGPASEAKPDERRHNKRFNCHCPARLHVLQRMPEGGWHEAPGVQVTMHSVSRFGLGLLSPMVLALGEHVRVYLMGRTWAGRFVHGQTVRCRAYSDGWFEVGVELFAPDDDGFEL